MLSGSRSGYVIHEGSASIRVRFEGRRPDEGAPEVPSDVPVVVLDGREEGASRTLTVDDHRVAVVQSDDHHDIEVRAREWTTDEPLDELVQRVVRGVRYDLQVSELFTAAVRGTDDPGPERSTACLVARCDDLVADFEAESLGLAVEGIVEPRRAGP